VAIEKLEQAGLLQYEISNFSHPGSESSHNLRYWQRRPYLGLGLDASSMLREALQPEDAASETSVLRSTVTDDLANYLANEPLAETAWLSPGQQHEEAWFLGLRLNAGVDVAALQQEFGREMVAPALEVVEQLAATGLLASNGKTVRLTERGRLLSNEVFQEFLGLCAPRR